MFQSEPVQARWVALQGVGQPSRYNKNGPLVMGLLLTSGWRTSRESVDVAFGKL